MTPTHSAFNVPWTDLNEQTCARVQALIPHATLNFVKSVCPSHGLISYIIQSTFHSLERNLHEAGLTTYSSETHDRIIASLRNGTGACADLVVHPGYVGGTTPGTCSEPANATNEPTILPQSDNGRRGERGTRLREAKKRVESRKTEEKLG